MMIVVVIVIWWVGEECGCDDGMGSVGVGDGVGGGGVGGVIGGGGGGNGVRENVRGGILLSGLGLVVMEVGLGVVWGGGGGDGGGGVVGIGGFGGGGGGGKLEDMRCGKIRMVGWLCG